jgi:predicted kinase
MIGEMRTIILTVGVPGSGKDTWATQEMSRYPGKYKRVNRDLMREMLDADQCHNRNELFINVIRDRTVEYALGKGYDVILSDTNLRPDTFNSMVEIGRRIGNVRVMEKKFDIPLKVCKERNRNRDRVVPEHVIDRMYKKFKNIKDIPNKDVYVAAGEIQPPEWDESKQDCIIVDIDGTIAKNVTRSYYDMTKVYEDDVIRPIVNLVEVLAPEGSDTKIIFLSGRDGISEGDTRRWIKDKAWIHGGEERWNLLMRKTGDSRKDSIVKEEIYKQHVEPYYNVRYVVDDRPQVIRMWKTMGLTVLQVNDLEF